MKHSYPRTDWVMLVNIGAVILSREELRLAPLMYWYNLWKPYLVEFSKEASRTGADIQLDSR